MKESFSLPKRYWYVILTYLIMQFSGIPVALFVGSFFPESFTQLLIYWSIFSFIAGLVVVLFLMKPDMQKPAHPEAAPISGIIGWSILGVFMALLAQTAAAAIETYVLGIDPGSENTQEIMNNLMKYGKIK